MRALDQCRRDVSPVLKQCHLLAHWGARLSSYIRRCHKHYEAACSTALRLFTQAKHTAHVHARHTSVPYPPRAGVGKAHEVHCDAAGQWPMDRRR